MKLAYILLAHQHPKLIVRLIKKLITDGSVVALHYDLKAGEKDFQLIKESLSEYKDFVFYADRVKVGWGEWSIIQATLNALQQLETLENKPDYVHLMSGADYPTRSETEFKQFLERNYGTEFIQAVNITQERWVTGGLSNERYEYRHYFNWQQHQKLFDWNYTVQKKFFPKRRFPENLTPHMGSQWWTLTWKSCNEILDYSKNPALIKFFQTVWIPDEMYIQTIVAKAAGKNRIAGNCLTLYRFNNNGLPLVFTNGHHEYLSRQPFFFARKISPYALDLRDQLDQLHDKLNTKNISTSSNTNNILVFDKNIGKHTKEYDDFVILNGNKDRKGQRHIGSTHDAWYGDLEWNSKPYYVIVGGSISELKQVQNFLNTQTDIICHGTLFNKNKIDFVNDLEQFAGFSSDDVALRDHSKPNFLVQVLRKDLSKVVAFLLPFGDGGDLLDMCLWDRNARIIAIKTNPFLNFYDQYKESPLLSDDVLISEEDGIKSREMQIFEKQHAAFLEVHQAFHQKHEGFWKKVYNAHPSHIEICLYDNNRIWMVEILDFINRHLDKDIGKRLINRTSQYQYNKWLSEYRQLHGVIPQLSRMFYDLRDHEQQIFWNFRNPQSGELSWNNKPYLVITGASLLELKYIQEYLNEMPNIVCHGALFAEDKIDFANGNETFAGYEHNDVHKRDRYQQDFLARVIKYTKAKLVAFLLPFGNDEFIFNTAIQDNNARVIFVESSTLLMYAKAKQNKDTFSLAAAKKNTNKLSSSKAHFETFYKDIQDRANYIKHVLNESQDYQKSLCLYDHTKWDDDLVLFLNRWHEESDLQMPRLNTDSPALTNMSQKINTHYRNELNTFPLSTAHINCLQGDEYKFFWKLWQVRYRVI